MKTTACAILLLISAVSSEKLDNTYLPPNSANSAGGNEDSLHAPTREYGSPINVENEGNFAFASVNSRIPTTSSDNHRPQPSPVYGPVHQVEVHANILRFDNDNDGNGNYHFDFETENKIRHEEHGQLKQTAEGEAVVVQGSYSYVGDDGRTYTVTYVADENGFQPAGEHIDEAISKSASEAAKSATNGVHQQGYNQYNGQEDIKAQGTKSAGYQY